MSNYPKVKEYQINFIDNLPYKLGSTFDENNIDLELKKKFDIINYYRSYKHSEIILFGTIFESDCYLWFAKDFLCTIEYKFENKYFDWFEECINSDLPDEYKLEEDPFEIGNSPTTYIKDILICLLKFDKNFFLLRVSYHGRP